MAMQTVMTVEPEIENWYRSKEFAYDWTSPNFSHWKHYLAPLRDHPLTILEIGSYEGRSILFFLNFLPRATAVCVDAWDASVLETFLIKQMPELVVEYSLAEGRFDRNLAEFSGRVRKLKGFSGTLLVELGVKQERFDLIYVDGEHRRAGTYRDCVLSWPMLKPGGLMLLDDYGFDLGLPDELKPKQGIDAFLNAFIGQFDEVYRAYQIVIRKRELTSIV